MFSYIIASSIILAMKKYISQIGGNMRQFILVFLVACYSGHAFAQTWAPVGTAGFSAGAVVGQQPFGGARASGTNDKAGSILNLYRWLSARTIKETFVPAVDYRYAFHQAD